MRALFVFYDVTDDWRRERLAAGLRHAGGQWLQRSCYGMVVPSRHAAEGVDRMASSWLGRGDRLLAVAPCPACTPEVRFLPRVARLWHPDDGVQVAGGDDDLGDGGAERRGPFGLHQGRTRLRLVADDGTEHA